MRYGYFTLCLFRCEYLCYALLRYASLRCAFLRYAFLRYASLRYSSLRYGYLCYVCLRSGCLCYGFCLSPWLVLKSGTGNRRMETENEERGMVNAESLKRGISEMGNL